LFLPKQKENKRVLGKPAEMPGRLAGQVFGAAGSAGGT